MNISITSIMNKSINIIINAISIINTTTTTSHSGNALLAPT